MTKYTKALVAAFIAAGSLSLSTQAETNGGDTANQTVLFSVAPINQISVSGSPEPLIVNFAIAGSAPVPVEDTTTTYAVTTNMNDCKITGQLNNPMPAGVTLSVGLEAPANASAFPLRPLFTSAVDLVTGISRLNQSGLGIRYQLAATSEAGVVPETAQIVTFTILAQAD